MDIIENKDGNSTELPAVQTLKNLFENLGVSKRIARRVVR